MRPANVAVLPTMCPVTCCTEPCTAGTLRSPRVSSQPPAPQAPGLLKINIHTVTAWPAGRPEGWRDTLIPLDVRTRVQGAPGPQLRNTCAGPIAATRLAP